MSSRVWITKYALAEGIFSVEVDVGADDTMISYRRPGDTLSSYAHGKDWHRTLDAAKLRADEMRTKKIANMKKQLKKLSEMRFDDVTDY